MQISFVYILGKFWCALLVLVGVSELDFLHSTKFFRILLVLTWPNRQICIVSNWIFSMT